MPLYEYQCPACGRRVEKIQPVTAPETETCVCGGRMERLLSAPAIQFKGSGWYITDYAHKSGSPANGDGKSGEKRADKGGEKAAEKPATKGGDSGTAKATPAAPSSDSK